MDKKCVFVLLIVFISITACTEQVIIQKEQYKDVVKPEETQVYEKYENECSKEGLRECIGNDFHVCGYYDQDPALDWSSPIKCSEESYCQEGQCIRKDTSGIVTQQQAEPPQIAPQTTISQSGCQTNSDCPPKNICNTDIVKCVPAACLNDADCDDNNAATADRCFTESGSCAHDPYIICQTDADCSHKKLDFFAQCYDLGEISACLGCSTDADCKFGYCDKNKTNRKSCVSKLRGSINVGVIEFKLSDTKFNNLFYCQEGSFRILRTPACLENRQLIEKHDFLDLFNNIDSEIAFDTVAGKQRALSIYYIPTYLKNQAKRYGLTNLTINIDLKGPFDITKDFPKSNLTTPTGRPINPYLIEFFEEQINERKVDTSKYDLVFIVFFDDGYTPDRGRSTAQFTSIFMHKYFFIDAQTSTTPGMSDQIIQAMIHEFLHFFKAEDKYIEPCSRGNYWSCCKEPEGLAEPNKIPKYPQTKACFMCEGIPLKEDGESRGPQSIFEVEICDKTAEEIGWK